MVSMATINRLDLTTLNIELQLKLSSDIISDIAENFIYYLKFHKFLKETIYSRRFLESLVFLKYVYFSYTKNVNIDCCLW